MTGKNTTKKDEVLLGLQTNPDVAQGRLSQALRLISEKSLSVIDVDRINTWFISPPDDAMHSVDSYDQSLRIHSSGEIISANQYPAFLAALQSERIICAKDVFTDQRTAELALEVWKPLNVASALIVPMRVRGKLAGMVRFEQSRIPHNWSLEEETFAGQIAEIVLQVFLVHEINEKTEQLRAHEDTIIEMTRLTNYHTMLTEALHRVIELSGARSAMLFKNYPSRREIQCLISVNTPISFTGIVMKYGEGAAGSVAEIGRSLRIQDYKMWSGRASQMEGQQLFTSVMAVPVRFQGHITGVIEVAHHDQTVHFTENHRRMLETYAHHIAAILAQSELSEQIGAANAHSHTLQQLISSASQAGRLDSFLDNILSMTLKRLGLSRGVLRVDHTPVMQEMNEEEEREINERLAADQSGFNSEIIVSDWRDYNGSYTALASLFGTMNIKSSLFAPFWHDADYRGYLGVFSAGPREWREEEISLLQLVVRQVVLTVEKINGLHDRETASRDLVRLNCITSSLNRLFSFEDAVARVGQGAVDLMDADHALIFLKNPDGSMTVPWHFGASDSQIQKGISAENKDVLKLLLGNRRPAAFHNLRSTPLPPLFKRFMANSAIATAVCLPLVYSNQTVGAVVTFHNQARTLSDIECDILEAFTNQAAVTLQNAWMFDQLDKGYTDLALSLARAIDAREADNGDHTHNVARWAEETGRKLGLNDQEVRDLHWAALLHDIGKSSIPPAILEKPGPLSEDERKAITKYPLVGAQMIQPLSRFQSVSTIIRHYREHFDGSGYPEGLQGEDIPLPARVLSVADAYNSIINDRPYHRARSQQEALQEIAHESGKQFDPVVVKSFLEIIQPGKISASRKRVPD